MSLFPLAQEIMREVLPSYNNNNNNYYYTENIKTNNNNYTESCMSTFAPAFNNSLTLSIFPCLATTMRAVCLESWNWGGV